MAVIVIIICITIGIQTNTNNPPSFILLFTIIDYITQYSFLLEFILKIISEEFQPWLYFYDNWNKLDFIILIIVFIPIQQATDSGTGTSGNSGSGNSVLILRLLRLLRIIKIVQIFTSLRTILIAIIKGISGIIIVAILLLLTLYIFGILGVMLFSQNDPWHFSTLHMAMYILLDAATLDNWSTSLAYIDIYGCMQYPWNFPELCINSNSSYIYGSIYYIAFIFICGFLVITLFIGVVNINMVSEIIIVILYSIV